MPEEPTTEAQSQLEGGAYEIIRSRLDTHAGELRSQLTKLNTERQSVFGAVEPALIGTDRVSTPNNCIARGMIAIGGNRFLFGFNVHMGLKSTTDVSDVFGLFEYHPDTHTFSALPLSSLLDSGSFLEDFAYLYKYYRDTVFAKFMRIGPHIFMAFRIGKSVTDIKTFKWRLEDDQLTYIGNRSDHEYQFPPQQEFEWQRAHRGMYREGMHPHVSINDRLFVETVGGDLTIKIEDNTDSGAGIYTEDVTNDDQTLDDAEIFYALVGNLILLKILPYQEKDYRYLVYNEKTQTVARIDSIANSCVLLPEDHGIIFSDGYHLQTGETKRFDNDLTNMIFERRIASPNGEDYLYVFYNRRSGVYILMSYNIIDQQVETPIICHGFSVFPNGELIYFRTDEETAQKHHALQIWQTPYMEGDFRTDTKNDSFLFKIGNADIVRAMAECHEVLNLLGKDDSYSDLYFDLSKKAGDIADSYFWIGDEAAFSLGDSLREIQGAAQAAIAEFDKVRRLRKSTSAETEAVTTKAAKLVKQARNTRPDDIMGFVHALAELRTVRGEIISLRDLRYANLEVIDAQETEVISATETVSQNCVEFLLKPEALDPYRAQVNELDSQSQTVTKVTEADEVGDALDAAGAELEMLIDIVSNLKIEDATQTTQIIDDISTIYASLNGIRSALKNRRKTLAKSEGAAQFGAQMKLVNQAVINYLDLCDTPEKCDEYLSKTMVQLEELEGRFSDFEDYIEELTEKRDEAYNAFEARKLALVEKRNKRAGSLVKSAERVLSSIRHRLESFESINEINGYLAGDLMVEKVRDVIAQLNELGDNVKADDIQTQLKTVREDAVRQLKDRSELFVDGKNIIQLGNHQFSVNTQELELSIVPHDGHMCFHLAGTDFFEIIADEEFLATKEVWEQEVLSENDAVYRSEYLAWQLLQNGTEPTLENVQQFMAPRYQEGYTKGVHDKEGLIILDKLTEIDAQIGLLRYPPQDRAQALLSWAETEALELTQKLASYTLLRPNSDQTNPPAEYLAELETITGSNQGAHYLFGELTKGSPHPVISPQAAEIVKAFRHHLTAKRLEKKFETAVTETGLQTRFRIIRDWITGLGPSSTTTEDSSDQPTSDTCTQIEFIEEAAVHLALDQFELSAVHHVDTRATLTGLSGNHPKIGDGGVYEFDYLDFTQRLRRFEAEDAPRFAAYVRLKTQLIEEKRAAMRLDEFKAKVMSAFVRNRLLDRIYLPMIGDNLAKQMGTAGTDTRTDRMGMLLLISPPGYGKTTLMEYIANRLGITFMKINGPAIGHEVTSLDPADAPNASAREEIMKLNLSLEMGDNVMIYLDDIQHCNPEFLQKFISLCDAQRKIEGVYNGQPKTYDLRGKKVCVIMAGNPYTESGGKFQIPDMLANRADTYNLGDIIGGHGGDFEASYIENALTSNPVLGTLASRSQADVYAIMKIAETGSQEGIDFEGNYSMEEIEDLVGVMKKLFRVRDTILRVNLEYIRSAAMEDAYRTEPAFKLQGSYRNMNRIAEKILPIMTDAEVQTTIFDHYENEAQTLTSGAESNLLKFRELEGVLTKEESSRWEDIRSKFNRNQLMGGRGENDPITRITGTLATFTEGLGRIENVLSKAAADQAAPATLADITVEKLTTIIDNLRAVPVEVEIKVVPVHEGEDAPAPKKKSTAKKKRISGKDKKLPVDIEAQVEQKD